MRLWTLHPGYLDPRGLVALWRESLLARKVLEGRTRGYRAHPQLSRFRAVPDPLAALDAYLAGVHAEAVRRGYRFDASRVRAGAGPLATLRETSGQLLHEWEHLLGKLRERAPALHVAHLGVETPRAHPLFTIVPGPVAEWERAVSR
jgi:hypothetical protein